MNVGPGVSPEFGGFSEDHAPNIVCFTGRQLIGDFLKYLAVCLPVRPVHDWHGA